MTTGMSLLTLPSLAMPVRAEEDIDAADDDDLPSAGTPTTSRSASRPSASSSRPSASIILIDYAVNDAFELQVQNSKLSREVYRNAKELLRPLNQSAAVYQQVTAATEAMIRYLLSAARVPSALLIVEGSCWRSIRNTSAAHALVGRHYGVAFLDFPVALREGIRPVQEGFSTYRGPFGSCTLTLSP